MLHCDHFRGPQISLFGPMLGSILFLGASRADKSRTSRTATPFLLIFESVQNGSIFEGSRGRLKNDPCAPWDGKGTTKTPRPPARSSPCSPSWDLGSLGTPRARQGLIKINQGKIKRGLLIIMQDLTRLGPKAQRICTTTIITSITTTTSTTGSTPTR